MKKEAWAATRKTTATLSRRNEHNSDGMNKTKSERKREKSGKETNEEIENKQNHNWH